CLGLCFYQGVWFKWGLLQVVNDQSAFATWLAGLGGQRSWFLCPSTGCQRRVAKLYLSHGRFACRHCLGLAYQSQRESDNDRLLRRADCLRSKMGWTTGVLNSPGMKPKGMHQRTYDQFFLKYADVSGSALQALMALMEQMTIRIE
ncbi:MAG: hypothetical protein LAT80_14795, partial [Balneolaceae bacterium]|nr:hypothetical protein [Balneolaceae bacterium]